MKKMSGGYMPVNEKDWKIFRERLPIWQEEYMKKLNNGYMELLRGNICEGEKFWELEKKINVDKYSSGVFVRIARSELQRNLVRLIRDGVIEIKDLDGFSAELIETVKLLAK